MTGARPHLARAAAVALALVSAPSILGCYTGSARGISPRTVAADPGWTLVRDVPFVHQRAETDCGAAAMAMVLSYWALPTTAEEISARYPSVSQRGIKAGELRDLARGKGLAAFLVKGELRDLSTELGRGHPILVGLYKPHGRRALAHYEVVIGIHAEKRLILSLDPAHGWRENSIEGFAREWIPAGQVALVIFRTAP